MEAALWQESHEYVRPTHEWKWPHLPLQFSLRLAGIKQMAHRKTYLTLSANCLRRVPKDVVVYSLSCVTHCWSWVMVVGICWVRDASLGRPTSSLYLYGDRIARLTKGTFLDKGPNGTAETHESLSLFLRLSTVWALQLKKIQWRENTLSKLRISDLRSPPPQYDRVRRFPRPIVW